LGAVLYEMLSLQRPFTGESRDEILNAIMTKDPRPLRRLNPRVPNDLQTICQKAMEKDRDLRYQSAADFAYDLRQYLRREVIIARRPNVIRRTRVAIRRHPTTTTIAVAAILVALVIGMAWHHTEAIAREAGQGLLADPESRVGDEERRPLSAPMGAEGGSSPEPRADGQQASRTDLIDSPSIYIFR